jgi:Alw26I/Eco31I/Esp3I family type II restriction m6 adenine DNA methyltransferase
MEHVEVAKRFTSRTDLEKRLTGRFYTPDLIAQRIANQAISACPEPESVCDPFCGDGRLIVNWLHAASRGHLLRRLRRIVLWDYDVEAIARARESVRADLCRLGLSSKVSLIAESGDSFERVPALSASVDAILTNPPWELLKPDVRDGLGDVSIYKGHLRKYASMLAESFPGATSAKGKAMTGYGVNLARAGAIASAMLAKSGGVVSIVLPSSIFADQASGPFRRELFSRLRVTQLDLYPAEARLFEGVDQPFITATAIAGSPSCNIELTRHGKGLEVIERRGLVLGPDRSMPIALNVSGEQEAIVNTLASSNPPLRQLESDMEYGLWLGRELDETRLSESLAKPGLGVPFLKGRHVFPFEVVRDNAIHIDPTKRQIPSTVREARLAWRDVSRPNQRRRMHVALVPDGNVTGNSLGIAYFRYAPPESVRILMAIMNSLSFEIQVRTNLATAHVSQGILRKCSVPLQCFRDGSVKDHVLRLVDSGPKTAEQMIKIEVAIAHAYGIARDQFETMLHAFPKLSYADRAALLRRDLWS